MVCVAGVRRPLRFDQEDMRLCACTGTMFSTAWDDEQLALPQVQRAVSELDLELALEDEEEVVGVRMAVPDELALDLDHLDLVVVHRRDDARREALVEERQLLREIDWLIHATRHSSAPTSESCAARSGPIQDPSPRQARWPWGSFRSDVWGYVDDPLCLIRVRGGLGVRDQRSDAGCLRADVLALGSTATTGRGDQVVSQARRIHPALSLACGGIP